MGANRGVNDVEDEDAETGESEGQSEGKAVRGEGRLVVRRLVDWPDRVDRGCIVVVAGENGGNWWLVGEGRAVCRLV